MGRQLRPPLQFTQSFLTVLIESTWVQQEYIISPMYISKWIFKIKEQRQRSGDRPGTVKQFLTALDYVTSFYIGAVLVPTAKKNSSFATVLTVMVPHLGTENVIFLDAGSLQLLLKKRWYWSTADLTLVNGVLIILKRYTGDCPVKRDWDNGMVKLTKTKDCEQLPEGRSESCQGLPCSQKEAIDRDLVHSLPASGIAREDISIVLAGLRYLLDISSNWWERLVCLESSIPLQICRWKGCFNYCGGMEFRLRKEQRDRMGKG